MAVTQISVFLANKPGALDRLTRTLSEGGVDLRAISVSEAADYGIARLLADDHEKAAAVLEADFIFTRSKVLLCPVPDEAGGLYRLLTVFTGAGLNIEYMYSCIVGKSGATAFMIFRVSDPAAAEAALAAAGLQTLTDEDLIWL